MTGPTSTRVLRLASVAVLLAGTAPILAQGILPRPFGARKGLAQSLIQAIARDSHGYLWVGGQGGLSRGDRQRFTPVTASDDRLQNDSETALTAVENGQVWYGTDSGILRLWDGRTFTSWPVPGASRATVSGLVLLDNRTLLVGTESGLWRWSPERSGRLLDWPVRRIPSPPGRLASRDERT